jgi:deoxyribonuclease V
VWPSQPAELIRLQEELAHLEPDSWVLPERRPLLIGACFFCAEDAVERAWAGACTTLNRRFRQSRVVAGVPGAPYMPGLLALREGPLLAAAIGALPEPPEVLIVNATGRDHPRRAGLALHLGAALGLPTIGVTDRTLLAAGDEPAAERGSHRPLLLDGREVGCRLRTRRGARPIAVHCAWRTDVEVAVSIVMAATKRARTPEPLRRARRLARMARAEALQLSFRDVSG